METPQEAREDGLRAPIPQPVTLEERAAQKMVSVRIEHIRTETETRNYYIDESEFVRKHGCSLDEAPSELISLFCEEHVLSGKAIIGSKEDSSSEEVLASTDTFPQSEFRF
ncbi:MAG: hypothetical protein PHW63_09840 [Alphaproteobacteria bacterium]|nr:hypothetical protein [Alphaproteobacteria bacterium]